MRKITIILLLISLSVLASSGNALNFSKKNTVYEISNDYDLAGKTVSIPSGCTLRFKGGIIKNGILNGNGTLIEVTEQQIFGTDIHLIGSWHIDSWIPEWFGAKGEKGKIDTQAIQCALDAAKDTDSKIVKLQSKTYYTDATLSIYPYTTLIGAEKTSFWLYASQIVPTIKVDAIKITAAKDEVRATGISLKNIIIRNGSGVNYTNVGIQMGKDTERFGVDRLRMENVQVLYFEYGIKADLYGNDAPFAYCNFRNVECSRNNIGFCVDGHFEGEKKAHKAWMNVNRFEFCRFSENRVGGILVQDVWMFLNNVFDQCTFEGNGRNYTLPLYNKFGVYGAKFANRYSPITGGNVFQNCYFEGNFPRRTGGKAEKGEYLYEDLVFPEGFTESKITGNVILQQHDFIFSNCLSSRNKCFVLLNDNCRVNITGTTVYDLEKVSKKDTIRYFVEFNDAYVQSSVNSERNYFNISKDNKLQYFHFIATPQGANSKYTIHKTDIIDGGEVQLNNMSVRQLM